MKCNLKTSFIRTLGPVSLVLGLTAASSFAATENPAKMSVDATAKAKALIDKHCTLCHLTPAPSDLSREYWPFALHYMGYYVGMKGDEFTDMRMEDFPPMFEPVQDYTKRYFLFDSKGYMRDLFPFKKFIPPQPQMSKEEWLTLREYYESNAKPWTEMLIKRPRPPVVKGFKPVDPGLQLAPNGNIIATQVDPKRKIIYVGTSVLDDFVAGGGRMEGVEERDHLIAFDIDSGKPVGDTIVESDIVHMTLIDKGVRVLEHGRFPMGPEGIGNISDYEFDGVNLNKHTLVGGKHRLVKHDDAVDMDGDGLKDIVSVAFGDGIYADANSELAVYWKTPRFDELAAKAPAEIPEGPLAGALEESILSRSGGLIGFSIGDMNNDGRPDVVALVAQAREDVLIFINNGDRTFTRHLIDERSPAFGGNVVEVADFNGDGKQDIALLNGDNVAGNSVDNVVPAPRPYNGIYIYQNHGDLKFTTKNIYPFHGATRAVVHDFDEDGDPDIAAVALYVQWNEDLPQGFVYLENKGDFNFEAHSLPKQFFAPFIHVEAADVNGDNKMDMVLGLGNYPPGMGMVPTDWLTKHKSMEGRKPEIPSVLYLINQF